MLTVLLIVAAIAVALAVLFYVGSFFLQGYFYTQPSDGLAWQAPAAAALLGGFFFVWCYLVLRSPEASPADIPYDTLFRFSPRVDLLKTPAKEIWAYKANDQKTLYKLKRIDQNRYVYEDSRQKPWRGDGVDRIEIVEGGERHKFKRQPAVEGGYRQYVNEKGWVIREFDSGPTGVPTTFRWGRFTMNLVLNFAHFLLWFVALWPILRFQWAHALGLAIVAWLIFTIGVLPMMLAEAAARAQQAGISAGQ